MAGQKFVLGASKVFLGREPENDIVLPDPSVSPRHAGIQRWNNRWWIADLGSATGTFVNERRLLKPVVLSPGDVIRLGNVRFRVLGISPGAQAEGGPSVEPVPHRRDRPPGSQRGSRSAAAWFIAGPPLVAVVAILLLVWTLGKDGAKSPVPTGSHRAPEPLTTIRPAPGPVLPPPVTPPAPPTLLAPASPTGASGTPSPASLAGPESASPTAPTPTPTPPLVILGDPVYHPLNAQDTEFGWAREKEQNAAWVLTLVLTPTSDIEILGPFF
ncbi:MAG: FHA domain-containing protein, partial [Thermodesulfobacteriota bacterium]